MNDINKYTKNLENVGISRPRPNEVGNDIEAFLIESLNRQDGFDAQIPKTVSGKHRSAGYPDVELNYDDKVCYIECKTYNIKNIDTTQRSFYLSPSSDFKVCKDGLHIIVSFEVCANRSNEGVNVYKAKGWKILDACRLECDVKYEFNSDNKRMYARELILAQGDVVI